MRDFLFQTVYERPEIREEFDRAQGVLKELWAHFHNNIDEFREKHWPRAVPQDADPSRAVAIKSRFLSANA